MAEGVYFMSWPTLEYEGNHIAVNTKTMKIYDHINENGERIEAIYDATYFGERKEELVLEDGLPEDQWQAT